jgi:Restriction endonuclease
MPNTGCGPDGKAASFDGVARVLVAMAAAALREFWVVEDRDRVLGPPRITRTRRSRHLERRVVYLPRIRYIGGQNLVEKAERVAHMKARAAHWRSEHYRKLPVGQRPTVRQIALAEAFKRSPPDGCTWVRGASVAGVETERVYRSRSLAVVLFDIVPSKAKALSGLSWFEFEQHCTRWLRSRGFDEVARTSIDNGVDITAFGRESRPLNWAIQCKHWTRKVGPDVVRELEGARVLRKADRAMLIVSSAFTPAAVETASQLKIDLIDGDSLSHTP